VELKDIWAAAAILIGFELAGFSWRMDREMKLREVRLRNPHGGYTWFPPADYLNLFSLLVIVFGVFLLPMRGTLTAHAAGKALVAGLVLFAGYPFAVLGHYGLLFTKGKRELPGEYCTAAEGVVVAVTVVVAVVSVLF